MAIYTCPVCLKNSVTSVSHHCQASGPLPARGAAAVPVGGPAAAGRRKLSWYASSRSAMVADATADIVPVEFRKKWDHALANFLYYATGDDMRQLITGPAAAIGAYTVADYAAMADGERYQLLNMLWNKLVIWVKGNQKARQMFDAPAGNTVHFTAAQGNRVPLAFQAFGIGFRCEKEGDLGRVLKEGFRPLFRNLAASEAMGYHVTGTVMDTLTRKEEIAFWIKNQDVVGNTGICIARNLRGATKFPEPMYDGTIYAFAVRPQNNGYDTEAWQASQGNTAVWRPGEKVFPWIGPEDVVAYTKVQKTPGGSESRMWTFKFLEAHWKYMRPVSTAEKAYLDGELAALRALGTADVPKADDFYRN